MCIPFSQKRTRPLEVLVLDDDYGWRHQVAANMSLALETQPLLASNAVEALELMSKHSVDVVVSDLFMPGMDGFQFLQCAKILFPETKVILLSGDFQTYPVSTDQMIERGALATIPKTEISSTLLELLRILQWADESHNDRVID